MNDTLTTSQVRLLVPANTDMIGCVQNASQWFVQKARMADKQRYAIKLAIEELMLMLLRYSFDDGAEEGELEFGFTLDATVLRMQVICRALPFDLSMVPEYDPDNMADDASLSVLLLKQMVDRYRLMNNGKEGYQIELEWLCPQRNIAELEQATADNTAVVATPELANPPPATEIRPLIEADTLALARLVYRSYGYSYVSEYLYYPERIAARLRDGTLQSWVAVADDGQLAGHAALMRSTRDAQAVEWGIAVVDPRWRGSGLMKRVCAEAIRNAADSAATVLFAHAVSNHPYTQKACIDLAMVPTALLLGFAPASLKFRHINNTLSQRESTFISMRLLKPLPDMQVYLPPKYATALRWLAQGADIPLRETTAPVADSEIAPVTSFDSMIEPAVNVAIVNIHSLGADHAAVIASEQRRLCREKVDIIYLNIDLSSTSAPAIAEAAEAAGFFFAGLCPMQPWPYTLTMQYLNNLSLDYDAIHAVGGQATRLKALICAEQEQFA